MADEGSSFNFETLKLMSEDFLLEEVDVHIQENLEDELVKEALKSGVDLREYSKQIEQELQTVECASIQDYIKESQNIASLHNQIAACDEILKTMEEMLYGFKSDLGSISSEIQNLQDQSISMNIKLKNRQAVREELSQFVDRMVVPHYMINHILDSPVTETQFLEQLHELNHKINFVKEQSFNDAKSCQDVKEILEKLKAKAIAKIREFLLQKIQQFKRPMSNYQIPQNAMLKFRFFYEFLMANNRSIAKEIRDDYIDTTSKMYFSYFKSYSSRLMKLQYEEVADKDDLMGEDSSRKSFFSSKPALKNRATIFTLGKRDCVLTSELEAPIIVPHAAQKNEHKHSFESLFRSLNYALLDNSCREYLFMCDFFKVSDVTAQDLFLAVMGKTLSLFLKQLEGYVTDCYDSIAIFLSMHIVYRYQVLVHKREVPSLDKYWQTLLEILWPRFKYILEVNIQSIRDTDPLKLGSIDTRPFYITRRYAEFSAAILEINERFPDERVNPLLGQLQFEVENFILRMAKELPPGKDQLIFLINNYDLMLNVIMERTTDDSKESERFKELLNARMQEFVEEILTPHLREMIRFVKESEILISKGQIDQLRKEDQHITGIAVSFASNWKKIIEDINQVILKSFTNFKTGSNISQAALTQLIQYYHRFQKILNESPFKNHQARSKLIDIHHMMVEVKKHKTSF